MISHKERLYYSFYALLSFIIVISVGDLDKPFLTLDFPIGPAVHKSLIPTLYGFEAPIWGGHLVWKLFYSFLTLALSAPIMQKLLLFLILFLAGFSGYNIVPLDSQRAKFFAGLLYMLNPYTYVRIVVGHWLILFAYAVLPLALRSFIELLEKKGRKELLKFVLFLTPVGFNSHTLVIAFIALGIIFVFRFWQTRDKRDIKNIVLAGILFALLNVYWLIPFAAADRTLVDSIGNEDIQAFAPRIESFSALFTIASMHGFWRAGYIYAKDIIPYWQVLFILILFLAVQGFISHYRDQKIGVYVRAFGLIAVSGLVLAAGINSPLSGTFQWLFDHTLLKGMRDSHKFVTLLALSYSYLGALEVSVFERMARHRTGYERIALRAVVIAALVIPVVYSFTFFNGFAGQIRTTDYPSDWYEVNTILNGDRGDFRVLFFPWHQYMNFHWVPGREKRIANPAQQFFDKEVITGKNVEVGDIYRQVYSTEQLYVDFLIDEEGSITNLGELIAPLNIKYVLLAKEVDYKQYFFLFNQSDLESVMETENFYVFRNRHEVPKIYEAGSTTYIKDWTELLERSRNEDITQKVYLIGDSLPEAVENPGKSPQDYEKKSPVEYELKGNTSKRYLVFTEPFLESWELDGKKPMAAYGLVNAYEAGGTNHGEIRYERFYKVYLPSYIISLLVFIVLIAYYYFNRA